MKKLLLLFFIPIVAFCSNLSLIGVSDSKLVRHLSTDPAESGSEAFIDYHDQMVIKTYPLTEKGRKSFKNERIMMQKLQSPHTPRLIGWGETEDEGYLLISKAPGVSINSLIKKRDMRNLKVAVQNLGASLASFHSMHPIKDASRTHKKLAKRFLKKYASSTQVDADGIAHNYLTTNPPEIGGTIHRDLHPGNIFFDPATGKITLIDLEMARPGPLAYDYSSTLIHLEAKLTLENYSQSDINTLKSSFSNAYLALHPLSSEEIAKERTLILMDMAITFTNPSDVLADIALQLLNN